MQVPIPDDWNGTSWKCYQIEWPDSDQWLGQLLGALSLYTRGRYWDATTGSVVDAQAVGEEIYERNRLLPSCETGEPTIDNGGASEGARRVFSAMSCWELEDCSMPCIDISGLLKIENGNLYARDSCCEWILIGAIAGTASEPEVVDNPEYDPTADPPQSWAGCGKATAVINQAVAVMDYAWDSYVNEPWEFVTLMMGEFPALTLDRAMLLALWANINAETALYLKGTFVNPTLTQAMICKLAVQMEDTPTVTDDEYNHLRSSVSSAAHDVYSGDLLGLTADAVSHLYDQVMDCMGRGTLKSIMLSGAQDLTSECDCPGVSLGIPPGLDWFHSYDFTLSDQGFADPGSTGHYVAGQGWQSDEFGGYDINLTLPSPQKLNESGVAQNYVMSFVRMTVSYCDPWVSGARANRLTLHNGADVIAEMDPTNDGAHVVEWSGYLAQSVGIGANTNMTILLVRDECGAAAYKGIVSKIEVGGMGYDPLVPPTDP